MFKKFVKFYTYLMLSHLVGLLHDLLRVYRIKSLFSQTNKIYPGSIFVLNKFYNVIQASRPPHIIVQCLLHSRTQRWFLYSIFFSSLCKHGICHFFMNSSFSLTCLSLICVYATYFHIFAVRDTIPFNLSFLPQIWEYPAIWHQTEITDRLFSTAALFGIFKFLF